MKHFRIGSEVMVKRSDGRGEIAEVYGVVTETHPKTSWSPRGYMVQVDNEHPEWYPEKFVFER
jgi:hypothetical protein